MYPGLCIGKIVLPTRSFCGAEFNVHQPEVQVVSQPIKPPAPNQAWFVKDALQASCRIPGLLQEEDSPRC